VSRLTPRPLILASTSRYRRRLLIEAGIPHTVADPVFDERTLDGRLGEWGAERLAVEVARGKARSLGEIGDAVVLAGDQLAVLESPGSATRLLTKPADVDEAVGQLMAMAGRSHRLVNGLVLRDPSRELEWTATDVHVVNMGAYDEAAARAYVEAYLPLDCVGAYRLEDDAGLIERVEGGDTSGVIGLPIPTVRHLLAEAGVTPG
jgi:septum formation protein